MVAAPAAPQFFARFLVVPMGVVAALDLHLRKNEFCTITWRYPEVEIEHIYTILNPKNSMKIPGTLHLHVVDFPCLESLEGVTTHN